jgi:hypothetical protein
MNTQTLRKKIKEILNPSKQMQWRSESEEINDLLSLMQKEMKKRIEKAFEDSTVDGMVSPDDLVENMSKLLETIKEYEYTNIER